MFSTSAQTEGKELPTLTEVNGDVSGYRERLFKFVEAQSVELSFSERIAPAKGLSYGGKITLLSGMQPAEEFSTLVHEIAHEMLHRGDRRTLTTKQVRETEAEAVAFVVCQAVGLQTGTASADYIQLWHGDANLLRESLEAVQQTAAVILGGIAPEPAAVAASRITTPTHAPFGFQARRVRPESNQHLGTKHMRGEKSCQDAQNNAVNNEYRSVPITALAESATNPRKRFDAKSLEELAASFKTQGILAPLLVRELEESKYEVVAGARRLRAAKLAELEKLPVRVVKLTDAEAIEAQCVENLQREDIHPLEEALGFKSLLELGEPAYTIATIASRAGKSEAYVYGRIDSLTSYRPWPRHS